MTAPLLELWCAERSNRPDDAAYNERPGRRRAEVRATEPSVSLETSGEDELFNSQLGSKLRAGDEDAFTAVIATAVPSLIRYVVIRLGVGVDVAEDVVQEMFARLWLQRDAIPDRVTRAYLFTTVRNASFNIAAHNRVVAMHAARTASELPVSSEGAAHTDTALTLESLLARLPDRRRQAIELRYWGHLSYAEIADTLGTTPANAERLVARGLATLQELAEAIA